MLIELDLRKPKLSDNFNISRTVGISNYLIGKMKPDELIKSTRFENLSLIPSGPIPPNPSELISNGRLKELLNYLEKSFDYIILDTAPISPVTDAFIISPIADVTLFVIRHDYTPKVLLQKLEEQHKMDNLKNPSIIYNGVRGKGINKYGYGYGYGYGYTEDKDTSKKAGESFLRSRRTFKTRVATFLKTSKYEKNPIWQTKHNRCRYSGSC